MYEIKKRFMIIISGDNPYDTNVLFDILSKELYLIIKHLDNFIDLDGIKLLKHRNEKNMFVEMTNLIFKNGSSIIVSTPSLETMNMFEDRYNTFKIYIADEKREIKLTSNIIRINRNGFHAYIIDKVIKLLKDDEFFEKKEWE